MHLSRSNKENIISRLEEIIRGRPQTIGQYTGHHIIHYFYKKFLEKELWQITVVLLKNRNKYNNVSGITKCFDKNDENQNIHYCGIK